MVKWAGRHVRSEKRVSAVGVVNGDDHGGILPWFLIFVKILSISWKNRLKDEVGLCIPRD
jgi:hypothetical protein